MKFKKAFIPLLLVPATAVLAEHSPTHQLPSLTVQGASSQLNAAMLDIGRAPGGISLIDLETFKERNISSMADALRFVPGMWANSSYGSDSMRFSSRGSNLDSTSYDMNGIKLLQDGLPVTKADGNNHNRVLDPLAARFAEVARGANGAKYGSSNLGGAINFTSITARNGGPGMQLLLNGGTYGKAQGRATFSKIFNDQFDALVTVEAKHNDGYIDATESDRVGLYSNFGWQVSDSVENRFFVTYIDNNQNIASSLTRAQFDANPYQNPSSSKNAGVDTETIRLANKTHYLINDHSSLDVGFSYETQDLNHPGSWGLKIEEGQEIGAMARYNNIVGDHDWLVGYNVGINSQNGADWNHTFGNKTTKKNDRKEEAATIEVFAMDRWQITDDLLVTGSLQVVGANRQVNNGSQDINADYLGINPSLGLTYSVNDSSTVYGNVSRMYEPPTYFEVEDKDAANGEALEAMKGTVVEIGTRGNIDFAEVHNVFWDLSLYHAWINDEIMTEKLPGEQRGNSANIEATRHSGVEALFGATLALDGKGQHTLEPKASITINEHRYDGNNLYGDNDLPSAPGFVINGEAVYRNTNGFYIGPTFDVVDDRWSDFANTYKIDSYFTVGARAGWSNDNVRIFMEAKNLSNEKYVANHGVSNSHSATSAVLIVGAPVSVFGGIELTF